MKQKDEFDPKMKVKRLYWPIDEFDPQIKLSDQNIYFTFIILFMGRHVSWAACWI